jgi:hypothetical protein
MPMLVKASTSSRLPTLAIVASLLVCFSSNQVQAYSNDKSSWFDFGRNVNTSSAVAAQLDIAVMPVPRVEDVVAKRSRKKKTELEFEGSFRSNTHPLPNTSADRVIAFFRDPHHRDLVLKGGGNPTEQIPPTPELYEEWRVQSRIVQSEPPAPNDPILAISSKVPLLPGLSISATSYMGCKFLQNPRTLLPIYEFTLIKDEYAAQGSKPLVWIFNRMTGVGGDGDSSRKTHALSRVSMEPCEAGTSIVMQYFGFVKVSCSVPRALIRILPMSKKKAQEKVSNAMVKQLEREGLASIQKFQGAFEDWLEQR